MRDVWWQPNRILGRLFCYPGECCSLRLCLDDPDSFAIHEQQVIRLTGFQLEFAHCHAQTRETIELSHILNGPTAGGELGVDVGAGKFFGCRHGFFVLKYSLITSLE